MAVSEGMEEADHSVTADSNRSHGRGGDTYHRKNDYPSTPSRHSKNGDDAMRGKVAQMYREIRVTLT